MTRKRYTVRSADGRYDHSDMTLVCRCGHRLGVHAGEKPRPCFNDDAGDGHECHCEAFKVRS